MSAGPGLRSAVGNPAAPPYGHGPYIWDQQVTFTAGLSGANTPGSVWYVDGETGSSGNNGKSWTTALDTIQAAVDLAGDGTADVIYVAPHKYQENVIVFDKEALSIIAIVPGWTTRVRASDGATKYVGTTSGYTTQGYCFLLLSRNVTISGFTCDGGGGYGGVYIGDGGAITATGGLPSETDSNSANCSVRNCHIIGGYVGVMLHGASDNCVIENNTMQENVVSVIIAAGSGRTNQRPIIRNNVFMAGSSSTYGIDENNSATNVGTLVEGNQFLDRNGTFTFGVRMQSAGIMYVNENHFSCTNTYSLPATSWQSGNYKNVAGNSVTYVEMEA